MVGGVDQRRSSRRGGGLMGANSCLWLVFPDCWLVVGWLLVGWLLDGDKDGWWCSFLIVGW